MKFTIPEPKMPSADDHRAVSLQWLKRVQPCLIDQWPAALAGLSFKTDMVQVDAGALVDEFFAMHDGKPRGPVIHALAKELDDKMGWDRKFVRLNSRSPKDWPWPFHVPATHSGKEAVDFLCGSMRVLDDLYEFKWVPEQPAYICLREWQHGLRTEDEYRCFVKDGALIAVTAYDYTKPIEPPQDAGKAAREAIDRYFTECLKPTLHIDTVVFDLWAKGPDDLRLVEINPYGLSDPCFFGNYAAVENAKTYIQYEKPADGQP